MSQTYRVKQGCVVHTDSGGVHKEGDVFVPTQGELAGQRHALEEIEKGLPVLNMPSGTGRKRRKPKPEDGDADA